MGEYQKKAKREVTPEQAFARMARYCSLAERASSDVERLLTGYGVSYGEREKICARLVELGFLNEERYVVSFVRSKSRAMWGRHKISAALRTKKIPSSLIENALAQLSSGEDSDARLEELIRKKAASTKSTSSYDLKGKLLRFAMGRGFGYDDCCNIIDRVVRESE